MKSLFFKKNKKHKTGFYFTYFTLQFDHYDNCLYFKTKGTRVSARKVEVEERHVLDLLDDRRSGDLINITLDANTKSVLRLKVLHFKGSCHHFKDKHPHTRWPLS